jgi:hypothetical protein
VLDCGDSVERAVRARAAVAWTTWGENGGLLPIKSIQLMIRGSVYESYVRSGMGNDKENGRHIEKLCSENA